MKNQLLYKGRFYWEIQIAFVVLMWQHTKKEDRPTKSRGIRLGRFVVWIDSQWRKKS